MKNMLTVQLMEKAYLSGDPAFDGCFVVAIRTTGIFCRPTCPARKASPQNVEYFPSAAAARRAGYRPCKRCAPEELDDEPSWAVRLIHEIEANPAIRITDADLRERGIDPSTARRYFRRRYGLTFQEYARAHRLSAALETVRAGASVDEAVGASGYDSYSGFRSAFRRAFGVNPEDGRDARHVVITWIRTPLGPMIAGATGAGVCLLAFAHRDEMGAQLAAFRRRFGVPLVPGTNAHLSHLRDELGRYFNGSLRQFTVPCVLQGTAFQHEVWRQVSMIPYGATRSYEEIADSLGRPKAVRAVGHANGRNPIAIIVPCHRVVGKRGELTGYAGEIWRKERLLRLERARG